jgi:hypothetical protein
MNPIQEMLVLINVAKAHGEKTISVNVEALEFLLLNYDMLDDRLSSLEEQVFASKNLTDHPAYRM